MKRIISVVLLACVLCGMLAGCKAKKQANSATDIEVIYWETGYGRAWLDAVIKNFNDSQDQYHATLVSSAENRASEISRGDATGDLYIGSWNTHHAYKEYLYPLDEVLATKVDSGWYFLTMSNSSRLWAGVMVWGTSNQIRHSSP